MIPHSHKPIFLLVVGVGIFVSTLVLGFFQSSPRPPKASILAPAYGLVEFTSIEEISSRTKTPVLIPNELFESTFFKAGLYTEKNLFSKESISLIYQKNHHRFFELSIQPNKTLLDEQMKYKQLTQKNISLNEQQQGLLISLRKTPSCITSQDPSTPSFCEFSHVFLFEKDHHLLSLFGDSATEGELILIARSF